MNLLDALLSPLDAWSPFLALGATAFAAAALAVAVQRVATRPAAIERARNRMFGELLGAIVYRHDAGLVVRSLARFAGAVAGYLGRSLAPIAILVFPLGGLFALLHARYGFEPLSPGESTLLSIRWDGPGRPALEVPPGVRAVTPPIRVPDAGYAWRIEVDSPGVHTLRAGAESIRIVAGPGVSMPEALGAVGPASVAYRPRTLRLGSVRHPWYVFWLVDVFVLAWAIASAFGVRF